MYEPKTGDIFACYGSGPISRMISLETSLLSIFTGPKHLRWSPSHVAVVADFHGIPSWFESTSLCGRKCHHADKVVAGVQVHNINRRLSDYEDDGDSVDVYRLSEIDTLDAGHAEELSRCLVSMLGLAYDNIGAALSGTRLLKWTSLNQNDRSNLFCSELVAACFQRICLMNRANPSAFNPGSLLRELVNTGVYSRHGKLV